jgi:hypothetical protein
VNATGRGDPGLRVKSSFAWRRFVDPLPGPAKLTRRTESGLFGDTFHVEPRLAKQFLGVGDALTVTVFGNGQADVFVKEAGKMALAGARDARERAQVPSLGKVCGDGILNAMYSRMNVIATFQPRRELWVRTTAAQLDDEIARDCHGAGLVRRLMNKVQYKVDARVMPALE